MLLGRLVGQNWDRVSRAADRARETGCVRDEGCHRVRQGQGIERGREIGGYVQPPPEPQRYPAGESQNDGSGPHPRDSQGGGALPEGHRIAAHPTNDLRPCPAMAGRAGLGRQAVRLPPPRHRGAKVDQTGRPERSRQYVLTTKRRCTREWNRAPADLMPCSQQGRLKEAQPPMQGTRSPVFSASLPPGQPLAWKGAVLKA